MLDWISKAERDAWNYLSADGQHVPTRWLIAAALAATAVILFMMNMEVGIYDEALMMQGAAEVLHGHVVHRDFFWTYGPLQPWIIAALFSFAGKTVIVARCYDAVVRGGIIFLCGLAARRLGLRGSLVLGVMLVETALLSLSGFYLYPVFPSLLCALAGTLLLAGPGSGADVDARRLLGAGVLTGLVALLRYDIGVLLLAAHLATLGLFWLKARQSVWRLAVQIVVYGIGTAIVFVPVAAGAWIGGAVPGFIHDIMRFPPANYARMRGLPWPALGWSSAALAQLVVYVPVLTVAFGWVMAVAGRGALSWRSDLGVRRRQAIALLVLTTMFILKGLVRVSPIHSMLAIVPAVPLLLLFAGGRDGRNAWRLGIVVLMAGMMLIAANLLVLLRDETRPGIAGFLPARLAGATPAGMQQPGCAALPALGVGVVQRDTYRAACYVVSHTAPDEKIFVGAGRHDKVFANNVALYFISGREPATRWYHVEPGLQTTPSIQQAIIADLSANAVRMVVTDTQFDQIREPNDSAKSSGVDLLDHYIAGHYRKVRRFGTVTVYERRPPAGDDPALRRGRA